MRRGRLSKLQAGLMLPWTRPPYGYRLDPAHPRDPGGVMIEPAEAAVVAELFALYLEPSMTLAKLAKLLQRRGVLTPSGRRRWSCPTIRGILRNPTYTGQVYAQRTCYRSPRIRRSATHALGRPHGTATPRPPDTWIAVGAVPAVVSPAQFDQVQAKLAQNRSFARRHNTTHQYLLRALVSCGRCRLACTARTVHGQRHYYLCNGKSQAVHAIATRRARRAISLPISSMRWSGTTFVTCSPGRSISRGRSPALRVGPGCPRNCRRAARTCARGGRVCTSNAIG
jgi:site-specific DNA recombinase